MARIINQDFEQVDVNRLKKHERNVNQNYDTIVHGIKTMC